MTRKTISRSLIMLSMTLCVGLMMAECADAATIRFIQFVKTDGTVNPGDANRFHIGEIEAFLSGVVPAGGLDNANDQALSGLGAIGSTQGGTPQHGADSNLVSGVVNTGGSTWSRQNPLPIIAQVDLGASLDIGTIRVWQRGDGCCQNRLASFDIAVFADDGGGNLGALVDTQNFPGQVATNSFASFALPADPPPIPEPSTLALSALALLSLGFVGWRRRQQ